MIRLCTASKNTVLEREIDLHAVYVYSTITIVYYPFNNTNSLLLADPLRGGFAERDPGMLFKIFYLRKHQPIVST